MIPKHTIDQIYATADILEVIETFVVLKKAGANYKGLSPFTNERTPSFVVSPAKNLWKCFSSGKGGDVARFLMEHENFTWLQSMEYLAKKYNIEFKHIQQTDKEKEKYNLEQGMFLINEFASKQFENQLWNDYRNKFVLTYLYERGFSDQTIKSFNLGFATKARQDLYKNFKSAGYKIPLAEKVGLIFSTDDGMLDRFRNRLMFPIHKEGGRIVGFGGRVIDSKSTLAKYINSQESEIYKKNRLLYGLYQARKEIVGKDVCYIVEGYTDVIQMHQTGIKNVVASAGTALTSNQIQLIARATKNVVLLFDSDSAGMLATIRSIDLVLEQGLNVKICSLPKGEDPDSFCRKNQTETVLSYLQNNSIDFIEFKANQLGKEASNDPVKKTKNINEIIYSISKIPDPIKRELYIRSCSRLFRIEERLLFDSLAQQISKENRRKDRLSRTTPQETEPSKPDISVSPKKQDTIESNPINDCMEEVLEDLVLYGAEEYDLYDIDFKDTIDDSATDELKRTLVFRKIDKDIRLNGLRFQKSVNQDFYDSIMKHLFDKGKINQDFLTEFKKENPHFSTILSNIEFKNEKYSISERGEIGEKVESIKDGAPRKVNDDLLTLQKLILENKVEKIKAEFNSLRKEAFDVDSVDELDNVRTKEDQLFTQIIHLNKVKNRIADLLERIN